MRKIEYLLTRLAAVEPLSDDEGSVDQVADGGPGGLALQARGSGDGAIAGVDAGPQSERKPLVTLRKITDGRISCSLPLLVGGTRRSARKTKNLLRHALTWRLSSRPAGWA